MSLGSLISGSSFQIRKQIIKNVNCIKLAQDHNQWWGMIVKLRYEVFLPVRTYCGWTLATWTCRRKAGSEWHIETPNSTNTLFISGAKSQHLRTCFKQLHINKSQLNTCTIYKQSKTLLQLSSVTVTFSNQDTHEILYFHTNERRQNSPISTSR